jgi:uncharacterized glyoxalase superfamily protein PhnB
MGSVSSMAQSTPKAGLAAIPAVPYRNVSTMADWLCTAFGFQKQSVARSSSGEIKHAELTFGESTIVVFPFEDLAPEKLVAHPDQVGGLETQTCYLVVADIEAHCRRAKASGAEIIFDVSAGRYGGRGYASRDPEGHVWMFGTYDPRVGRSAAVWNAYGRQKPGYRAHVVAAALAAVALISAGATTWAHRTMEGTTLGSHGLSALWAGPRPPGTREQAAEQGSQRTAERAAELAEVRAARNSAEQKASDFSAQAANEAAAAKAARDSEQEARRLLARALVERDSLAQAAKDTERSLAQVRVEQDAAVKAARDAAQQEQARVAKATAERAAKETSERCAQEQARAVKDSLDRLTRERNARAAAELAANELRNQLASIGTDPQNLIHELRRQIEAERRTRSRIETEAQDAKLLLAQEKYSRDATERALKQAEQKLASNVGSCWACPTGAQCARPQ